MEYRFVMQARLFSRPRGRWIAPLILLGLGVRLTFALPAPPADGVPPVERTNAIVSLDAIERVLGQLATEDEARLREPLMGMRLAAEALSARQDDWSARQMAYWTDVYAARVAVAAIPDGARSALMLRFVRWRHDLPAADSVTRTG